MEKGNHKPETFVRYSDEVIIAVVKDAASMCYGVTGFASEREDALSSLLSSKKEKEERSVVIHKSKDGYEIDIYVVLAYGLKVTEVISSVQNQVAFTLHQKLSLPLKKVNVFVEDIKEI